MNGKDFVLKFITCAIIVAALLYYNQTVSLTGELLAANKQLEEVAALSAAAPSETAETAAADNRGPYTDGTYSGTAQGYGGPITTQVTISGGYISSIEVTAAGGEDAAYYNMALDVLDQIAASQSADADTISGATYSSSGIINGACEALKKAE